MIGGGGEKLLLRAVARHADWYNAPGSPIDVIAHKLNVLREHCANVGRDYDTIVKTGTASTLAVAASRAEAQRSGRSEPVLPP